MQLFKCPFCNHDGACEVKLDRTQETGAVSNIGGARGSCTRVFNAAASYSLNPHFALSICRSRAASAGSPSRRASLTSPTPWTCTASGSTSWSALAAAQRAEQAGRVHQTPLAMLHRGEAALQLAQQLQVLAMMSKR